jgi:hypothetical protein
MTEIQNSKQALVIGIWDFLVILDAGWLLDAGYWMLVKGIASLDYDSLFWLRLNLSDNGGIMNPLLF